MTGMIYIFWTLWLGRLTNQRSATEMLSDRMRIASREIGQIATNQTEYYLKDLIPIMGIEEIFLGVL